VIVCWQRVPRHLLALHNSDGDFAVLAPRLSLAYRPYILRLAGMMVRVAA
jgi:hypothetical protein